MTDREMLKNLLADSGVTEGTEMAGAIETGWDAASEYYQKALRFASGYLSCEPRFSSKHPQDVMDWIIKSAHAVSIQPPQDGGGEK